MSDPITVIVPALPASTSAPSLIASGVTQKTTSKCSNFSTTMIPHKLPINTFTEGDAFPGIPAISILINGLPPDSPIESVTLAFEKVTKIASEPVVVLYSGVAGEVTIVSAANWEINIPEQVIPGLTEGKWIWQIRFISAAGMPYTYLGDELTVLHSIKIPVPAP